MPRDNVTTCATLAEFRTFVTDKSLADSLAAFLHHRLMK